jgi:hypothetical protein
MHQATIGLTPSIVRPHIVRSIKTPMFLTNRDSYLSHGIYVFARDMGALVAGARQSLRFRRELRRPQ